MTQVPDRPMLWVSHNHHTPFSLPIPDILCQTSPMRHLTTTICLTIAVLLGSAGVSWGADFQKGLTAVKSGDFATALREWKPLADQGHGRAQNGMGVMHATGKGVPRNYKTAVKWFKLSAKNGDMRGQNSLGVMYEKGQGVIQDYVRAHMWLNIAASSVNSKNASKNRDIVAKRMTPADISTAQKLARECVRKKYKGC